jgi:hypothetical protein
VHPHADTKLRTLRPLMCGERALSGDSGRNRVLRAPKCCEERVSLCVDLMAVVPSMSVKRKVTVPVGRSAAGLTG